MTTHIKKIITEFLKQKTEGLKEVEQIRDIVEKELDSNLKNHIHLQNIDGNRIIFYTESSSCGYEFNLKKPKVLKAVKEKFPQIEEIKIKIA